MVILSFGVGKLPQLMGNAARGINDTEEKTGEIEVLDQLVTDHLHPDQGDWRQARGKTDENAKS